MTQKQERFCQEFLVDGDAAASALRAGYSGSRAPARLMEDARVRKRIQELRQTSSVAQPQEVLRALTGVLRGETAQERVARQGSEVVVVGPTVAERLRAAELLGRHYGLMRERVEMSVEPMRIVDDIAAPPAEARDG